MSCWQGPGGFHTPWTVPATDPPLANLLAFPESMLPWHIQGPCVDVNQDGNPDNCTIYNEWFPWNLYGSCLSSLPGTQIPPCTTDSWSDPDGFTVWTGFYGGKGVAAPLYYVVNNPNDPNGIWWIPPTSIGCRVLGQQVDDHFGATVASDGTWLYISAPNHTTSVADVPALGGDRENSGVVYQLRTDVRLPGQPNMAQLWMEPFQVWPEVDAEMGRLDYTMPVPHQYIIETVGSTRGNYTVRTDDTFDLEDLDECVEYDLNYFVEAIDKDWAILGSPIKFHIANAMEVNYYKKPTNTAGYYTDRTPQIVGPHANAELSYVRGLGDINADGIPDFAVGSERVRDPVSNAEVGAIYILYGRSVGLEGDYLLENIALDPGDPARLRGVMLKGSSAGDKLARVFDDAGDFNNDGYADVVVGNESAAGAGEAIVILGSPTLQSPANGWTAADMVTEAGAIRFLGSVGDLVGANVAGVGDVDGDGYSDVLIAAPGAEGGAGAVYLIYGSDDLAGEYSLADIGTVDLPGVKFVGRNVGDQLGGGAKPIAGTDPSGGAVTADSRGVARLGDIDGDGRDDYAISAMLADPNGRTDAGEVYILYGRGD